MPIIKPAGQRMAYCVFCRSGYERTIANEIQAVVACVAVPVRKEKRENHKGKWLAFETVVLPGYLFLYAEQALEPSNVLHIAGVYRFLQYTDGSLELRGGDQAFAQWVYDHKGLIGLSTAVREGDHVTMVDGPLKELAGQIVRVDKRKCIAKVAIQVAHSEQYIWLSFDWLRVE